MKKIYIVFIFMASVCLLYTRTVAETLSMFPKGEIAYYQAKNVTSEEYKTAESIKTSYEKRNETVYTLVIADIMPKNGNEYIILSNGKLIIYEKNKNVFEFNVENSIGMTKAALDIVSFKEKEKDISILKYYILKETAGRKHIDLYLIRIENGIPSYAGEIIMYDEITSSKIPVTIYLENTFADSDLDGNYELLIAMKEKIGSRERKEYQIYTYSKKDRLYVCKEAEWDGDPKLDIERYFK